MATNNKQKGRPPRFKTPEELRAAVDAYFESCKGRPAFDDNGNPILTRTGAAKMIGETPPTMAGLNRALGFTNRHGIAQQGRRGAEFANVAKYARLRVENYNEMRLYDPDGYKGAAYVLKLCFGWEAVKEPPAPPDVRIIEAPPADDATPAAGDPAADAGATGADTDTGAGMLPAHALHVDLLN